MITIDRVSKSYGEQTVLEQVSMRIGPLDRIGLVGSNGAGKTTLLRIIEGREEADDGTVARAGGCNVGVLEQELELPHGESLLHFVLGRSASLTALEKEIEIVTGELERARGKEELSELAERQGLLHEKYESLGGYEREHRARAVLAGLGFPEDDLLRDIAALSGGWRIRAGLAGLLVSLPDLLLLDEPTNHLDLESVVWLEGYLGSFPGAILVISHDRRLLNTLTTRTALVENGRLELFEGNYDGFLRQREEQRRLLESRIRNQERKAAQAERFIERFRAKATKARQVQSRIKSLEKMERLETTRDAPEVNVSFPDPPRSGKDVLLLEGVSKSFGEKEVYRNLHLRVGRGERIALVGPNGAGKSTLLKLLAGVLLPDDGSVTIGHKVERAYFSQHSSETLSSDLTILEEASRAAGPMPESRLRGLLGRLLFTGDDVGKKVSVLSGGEKSRLALVRLLLRPVNLLLLDEPTNHLDMNSREALAKAFEAYPGTIVLISHDRHLLNRIVTKVFEINGGRVDEFHGDYDYYLGKAAKERESAPGEKPRTSPRGKERRQAMAGMREEIRAKTAPLKKRIRSLESEIEKEENRKGELEALLADPSFYGNADFGDRLREFKKLTERLERLHDRWEAGSIELDALERELNDKYALPPESGNA